MSGQAHYWMFMLGKLPVALVILVLAMVACFWCIRIFDRKMSSWDLQTIRDDPKAVAIFAGLLVLGICYMIATLFKGVMDNVLGLG